MISQNRIEQQLLKIGYRGRAKDWESLTNKYYVQIEQEKEVRYNNNVYFKNWKKYFKSFHHAKMKNEEIDIFNLI